MAITKEVKVDKIEVVGDLKQVQVLTATIITEDGNEISRSPHRYIIVPGQDFSNEPEEVQAICNLVHTDEVITAYQNYVANAISQDIGS